MKLSATQVFDAPRAKVFNAIINPDVIQRCIDGCEKMVRTGEGTYDAHLKIGVAGMKGNYVGKVQIKDIVDAESYTLSVEGKGGPGFVKGTARIRLTDQGGRTDLRCDADAQVGGMIAMIGSRLIEAATKRMMSEFFEKLAAQLQQPGG
jgi:carbon monoxide dehydrogenase subunit G